MVKPRSANHETQTMLNPPPALRHSALIMLLLCGLLGAARAEQGPHQAEVDAAVLAYEAGDLPRARAAFERLSSAGVPIADYNLAVMHLRGETVQPNLQEAVRLMSRAAEAGFVTAQFDLGRLFESGELDKPDLVSANRWYARAAENGSADAQVAIGTAYYLGRGAAQDRSRAAHWYREAAKAGEVGAQYLIASMYEAGDGVERDLRLARYWYDAAARNGDRAAPGKVKELDAKLGAVTGLVAPPAAEYRSHPPRGSQPAWERPGAG
jgi:uncharacterized protein